MSNSNLVTFIVDCNAPVYKTHDEVAAFSGSTVQDKFEAAYSHRPDVVRRLKAYEHDFEITPCDPQAAQDRAAVGGDLWDTISQDFRRVAKSVALAAEHVEGGQNEV